jgi:hypothetical protein
MEGRLMCRQSVDEPWRTISALVNAANDMLIAAIPTQIALLDGGGENSSTALKFPSAGTKSCQPPLPVCRVSGRLGSRRTSGFGGGNVVAITPTLFLSLFQGSWIKPHLGRLQPTPVSSA